MKLKICFYLLALTLSLNTIFAQDNQIQPAQIAETANAQTATATDELPRFEIGAQFTSLSANPSRVGVGGRFTININRNFALEAEGNVFPGKKFDGRAVQGLFGVKIGKRYEKFGIFAKARPGVFYQIQGRYNLVPRFNADPGTSFPFDYQTRSQTSFALDAGGVVEFYPTKKIVTRFDFGDTIIVTPPRSVDSVFLENNGYVLRSIRLSTRTTHNFQFSAGVGYRF